MNALCYDLEIVKAIPGKEPIPTEIECCEGWHDHAHMGISCLCAYDYVEDRYRVFMEDNLEDFFRLCSKRELLIGFNNIRFDNLVLNAHPFSLQMPIQDEKCYDLLREVWVSAGLGPTFVYPSHLGYSLDAVCRRNNLGTKTGDGAMAPILWQRGNLGRVIDYCLNDIVLTKRLFDLAAAGSQIISPKDGRQLQLKHPLK